MKPELEILKSKLKATWTAGDFSQIANAYTKDAELFVERLNLKPGMTLLDVACGSGNLAIPAARTGLTVTGMDLSPAMVERASENASREGLQATFEEGDVEALRYADGSFDVVASMFGAMFAPRPDVAASELLRVCKRGGKLVMANWTPTSFIGQMFKTTAERVPLPPGMPSPVLWGVEEQVRDRLGSGSSSVETKVRQISFRFPFPPADVVEHFRKYYGPTQKAFAALDEDTQSALRKDLEKLWADHNRVTDGTTEVESEYMEVIATRA